VTGEPTIHELTFKAKMMGTLEANINDWTFTNGPVVNLYWLKRVYKTNRDVVKDLNFVDLSSYDTVLVLADSVDVVESVTKALNDYGVNASSPLQWIDAIRQQIQTMQGFLGFIGAVSMLVAALSIANTMMMSIYERTREIGVMKVLGCKLSNIRLLFLAEAAYIGLIGGGLGLIASFSLSYALNHVSWLQNAVAGIMQSSSMFSTEGATASIIPMRLAWGTWLFVVVISLCSGMYPAYRAMRLSSLAAIRNAD
jgi:ABC-type antimicrobial peptide transport system permease subunit